MAGATDFRTPHLDRLAAGGARFTSWYSNSPVCEFFAGSLVNGVIRNGVRLIRPATAPPPPGCRKHTNLGHQLKSPGYQTYMTGKWHLGLADGSRPHDHGFDHWYGFMAGCIDYYSHIFYWGRTSPVPASTPTHDLWEDDAEIWDNGRYFTEMITEKAIATAPGQT
ncbi:MAG: sulfatase-like hydrolase/transferase [Caldilineaceae bacterium]